jgi:hypothetical protein
VGWAPLCLALAAEDGLILWTRPDLPTADVQALRDCALYEEKWRALRCLARRRGTEVVRLEGQRGPLTVTRRLRRFGFGRGRSRAEREMRALAEREHERPDAPARAIGWAEERRRGRVVQEYAISEPS